VYRLMRKATSLIHTSAIKNLSNSLSVILVLICVNVKTLIMLMLFLEQACGRPTWSLWATVGDPLFKDLGVKFTLRFWFKV